MNNHKTIIQIVLENILINSMYSFIITFLPCLCEINMTLAFLVTASKIYFMVLPSMCAT